MTALPPIARTHAVPGSRTSVIDLIRSLAFLALSPVIGTRRRSIRVALPGRRLHGICGVFCRAFPVRNAIPETQDAALGNIVIFVAAGTVIELPPLPPILR